MEEPSYVTITGRTHPGEYPMEKMPGIVHAGTLRLLPAKPRDSLRPLDTKGKRRRECMLESPIPSGRAGWGQLSATNGGRIYHSLNHSSTPYENAR